MQAVTVARHRAPAAATAVIHIAAYAAIARASTEIFLIFLANFFARSRSTGIYCHLSLSLSDGIIYARAALSLCSEGPPLLGGGGDGQGRVGELGGGGRGGGRGFPPLAELFISGGGVGWARGGPLLWGGGGYAQAM